MKKISKKVLIDIFKYGKVFTDQENRDKEKSPFLDETGKIQKYKIVLHLDK